MTDKKWLESINSAAQAYQIFVTLRSQAEKEYESRYGVNPSDVDDDFWIDTVQGAGCKDIKELKENAKSCVERPSTNFWHKKTY